MNNKNKKINLAFKNKNRTNLRDLKEILQALTAPFPESKLDLAPPGLSKTFIDIEPEKYGTFVEI